MSIINDVLEEYASQRLDEPLRNLSLSQNGEVVGAGTGHLSVGKDRKLVLELSVSWPLKTKPAESRTGSVIPSSEFLKVEADTRRGFKLVVDKLYVPQGREVLFPHSVRLISSGEEFPKASLTGVVTPFLEDVFFSTSWIHDENPMFGGSRLVPWLPIETGDLKVGLRKEPDQTCRLVVWSKVDGDPGVEAYAKAFLNALSFRVGRQIRPLGYSKSAGQTSELVLQQHDGPAERAFYQPLLPVVAGNMADYQVALLTQAADFFLRQENKAVLTALHVCWDAARNNFPIQCLLMCAALEGLADHIVKKSVTSQAVAPDEKEFSELKQRAIAVLEQNDETKVSKFLPRLTNGIKSFEFAKKIVRAGELLPIKIKITEKDLTAWNKLRHVRAHGNFDWAADSDEEFQTDIDRAACVANIVNKFVLALIGYKGPFRDYSRPKDGHCVRFPPDVGETG